MGNFSIDNWIIKLFEKWDKEIRIFIKVAIFFFILGYIGYFIKFGFEFIGTSEYPSFKTILYGLLLTILIIILFIIAHFSGGLDIDRKLIGLFLGLAVGGASIGLIAGLIQGFFGWIVGGLSGIIIIVLTIKLYSRYNEKT